MSYPWPRLAEALDFTPRRTAAPFDLTASFRQIERDLTPEVVAPPIANSHLLRGTWRDRRAVIANHRVGVGDDRRACASVVVELTPPLHLAAVFGAPRQLDPVDQVKLAGSHRWLSFQGADADAARAFLLSPAPPSDLPEQLADALDRGCTVTNSKVCWSIDDAEVTPDRVRAALDACLVLAAGLEARRATLPAPPWDLDLRRGWGDHAAARRFAFDASRACLRGDIAGASLEIAIEECGPCLDTTVDVQFPSSIGVGLELRKAAAVPRLRRWFGRGLKVGERAFDDAFVVRGTPASHVRRVLAAPSLRAALLGVVGDVADLRMSPHRVWWRRATPMLERAALDRHVDAAAAVVRALFEAGGAAPGPYR
ncbi:MAG: hypothetical protein JNK64_38385 [Myxococcales bacterium]|nr:hypothetical protein [Myxococcales bacterium]